RFRQPCAREVDNGSVTVFIASARGGRTGRSVSVRRKSSCSAAVVGYAENDDDIVYLTSGRNTVLEVPIKGSRYTRFEGAEELIKLIQAVAAGNFEETLWLRDSEPVRSVGRIFVDEGAPIEIRTSSAFTNPFASSEKKTCRYLPYSAG